MAGSAIPQIWALGDFPTEKREIPDSLDITVIAPRELESTSQQASSDISGEEFGERDFVVPQVSADSSITADVRPEVFKALNRWEGYVAEIRADEFVGMLRDLDNPAAPQEEATFDLNDVSHDDRLLLVNGAIFYWSVGYHVSERGPITRGSRLRFRRLPAWSPSELKKAKSRAAERKRKLFGL